jgi:endonuclease/exonuclease/phosphatase (EEP) superfamily protein YafD
VGSGYALLTAICATLAIGALFGFASPALDLFNHVQPVIFWGSLAALIATPVFVRTVGLRALSLSLAATAIVASSAIYVPEFVQGLAGRAPMPADERPVYTVMTFNVFGRNEEPDSLASNILGVDPDIVALQEYNPYVRRAIHDRLIERFPHFQYCAGGERAFVGLYAKLPFQPLDADACSASMMSTDRTARIMVRFQPTEGAPFSVATTHNDWPAPITRQVEQFNALRDALSTVADPVIMVGDFNSTPWSYALRGFVSESRLTRHTYNVPTFPTLWYYLGDWRATPQILPIDHVMTRGDVAVHSLETGAASGSDHVPIIFRFSVSP